MASLSLYAPAMPIDYLRQRSDAGALQSQYERPEDLRSYITE